MKRFVFLFIVLFLFGFAESNAQSRTYKLKIQLIEEAIAKAEDGPEKEGLKDLLERTKNTLILSDGYVSTTWVRKVKTGYYIGDEPVFKTERTYDNNLDVISKWLEGKKYKYLDVYCNNFNFSEHETIKYENGDITYVDYGVPDFDFKSSLRFRDYRSMIITKNTLTDSLKKVFGVTGGKNPVVIVGRKGDIIEKSVTVKNGIFDRVLDYSARTDDTTLIFNDSKEWPGKFNVLENVAGKKDTVVVEFNTVRNGVAMKRYKEELATSLQNTVNILSKLGFEHIVTAKNESLEDGAIVVRYKDYE